MDSTRAPADECQARKIGGIGVHPAKRTLEGERVSGSLLGMATRLRLRSYLTRDEVAQLLRAAKKSRHGARNHAMILVAYRHGLRASELVGAALERRRPRTRDDLLPARQGSRSTVHPLKRDETRALERLLRECKPPSGEFVFRSERCERMSRSAFWRVVAQAGERAGLPVQAYAHLLRHSCGYYVANKGCDLRPIQDYLGHKQIQNTVRYTALNPARFVGRW